MVQPSLFARSIRQGAQLFNILEVGCAESRPPAGGAVHRDDGAAFQDGPSAHTACDRAGMNDRIVDEIRDGSGTLI